MKEKSCSLQVICENGMTLHGTAAMLIFINLQGVFDAFLNDFASSVARKSIDEYFNRTKKK